MKTSFGRDDFFKDYPFQSMDKIGVRTFGGSLVANYKRTEFNSHSYFSRLVVVICLRQ